MKQVNVVLIVGVTIVFLFLNIYGLIEILRYLRDKQQLLRQGFNDEDEFLSTTEGTTTTRPTEPPTTTTIIFSSSTRASPVITSTYSKETNRISSTTTLARTTNSRERSRAPEHRHRHHHHHQQQHQHHSGTHRGHPLFIPTALTTPSTTTSRIHITTNKIFIPDPTTDRPRIEVHRPAPTETPRAELPRFGTPLYLPKSSSPAPPSRTVPPTTTTTISTTTSTTFRTTTSSTQPANEKDDVTIVTALLDIGRGEWDRYRRPLEQYHIFMENLLSLKNNMVIFTDLASYSFIHKYRKNMGEIHRTKIHLITLDDLPLSRHLAAASKIIEEERRDEKLWRSIWDPAMKDHPEARSAEYDVLVNSKTYFLYNASLEDPFSTEFFVWIDAGYGHGNQSVFPYNNRWTPHFPRGKISLIKLTPMHDSIRGYTIDSLYRRNWSVVSGGFVAGDKRATMPPKRSAADATSSSAPEWLSAILTRPRIIKISLRNKDLRDRLLAHMRAGRQSLTKNFVHSYARRDYTREELDYDRQLRKKAGAMNSQAGLSDSYTPSFIGNSSNSRIATKWTTIKLC